MIGTLPQRITLASSFSIPKPNDTSPTTTPQGPMPQHPGGRLSRWG
jgi:hypothetical protein